MPTNFINALLAEGPEAYIPAEDNWYGSLVGVWDFEWVDGKESAQQRLVPGEWIFSWIIAGQAMQDIFICPSRQARKIKTYPDAAYGTTIRLYDSASRSWRILYAQNGYPTTFNAFKDKDGRIIQDCLDCQNYLIRWIFSDIKPYSFHWAHWQSADKGETWQLQGELFAIRRNI